MSKEWKSKSGANKPTNRPKCNDTGCENYKHHALRGCLIGRSFKTCPLYFKKKK